MIRLFLALFTSLLLGLLLTACSADNSSSSEAQTLNKYQRTLLVFGTEVNLLAYAQQDEQVIKAFDQIEAVFQDFHHQWHPWEVGGVISQINQAIATGKQIEVNDLVKDFIQKTQKLSAQTDYLFDPAIGELIALWGFHGEHWQGPPPSDEQIQIWLQERPSIKDLEFDGNLLSSKNQKVKLDFGGNAKGLALNIARGILLNHQIEQAIINIGGDLLTLGEKPHNQAWLVGIQDPKNPKKPLAKISVNPDEAVFTSGTYQRFYQWQDQIFSHIINPNTGWPANSFASVTVVHTDPILADTAATALLIAGPENWQKIADQMNLTKILLITRDGKIIQTDGIKPQVSLL